MARCPQPPGRRVVRAMTRIDSQNQRGVELSPWLPGSDSVELWERIDALAERLEVLRHPFYVRWSAGSLTLDELAHHADQYRHAVSALADVAAQAARSPQAAEDATELEVHAIEERDLRLRDRFTTAVGGRVDASQSAERSACVAAWRADGSRPLTETLTTMYEIESGQPAIAATKLEGLRRHYGLEETAYFEPHAKLDVVHASQVRELIDRSWATVDPGQLASTAESTLRANSGLLDSVERATWRSDPIRAQPGAGAPMVP
jgi:pyrroloquinoline-quinone synthase